MRTYIPIVAFVLASFAICAWLVVEHHATWHVSAHTALSTAPEAYAELATTSPPEPVAASTPVAIPILVYHIVRPAYANDSRGVRALAVTPQIFDAELLYLHDAGYHVIHIGDLEQFFASSTPLPSKPIIISFDDGWRDQMEYAFPVLKKHAVPATFFVFTNAIGHRGFLSWSDLRTLLAAGMTIGDHTRSHPYLTHITSTSTLESEILGSRQLLEERLGVPINEFAYPFGQYNAAVLSVVRTAGYRSARGDYPTGEESTQTLFTLGALNAPTTTERFAQVFSR